MNKLQIKNQEYDAFQFLTLLYLHFSFDNLAVILPMEEKIDKIKRQDFQFIWTCNKNGGELYIPKYFYQQFNDYLKDNKVRFIAISLHLHSCFYVKNGGHSSILLYDKKNNQMERLECNGRVASLDKEWYNSPNLDKELKKFFEYKNIKYIPPKQFMSNYGPQYLQINENIENKNVDPNGFCVSWCILYVEMRVNNPHKNRDIIAKEINNISPNLTEYIRKYSEVILNTLT